MLQHFSELIDKVKAMPRTVVCVANADSETVEAARMALDEGLADVILYGDEAVVRPLVGQAGIEGRVELRHAADPATALREAVRSVRCGESGVLMKGMLNSSDFLRGVLNKEEGLRTGRRLSHIAAVELPGYHKLIYSTDGGMNIDPDLAAKKDILANALLALRSWGYDCPKVGVLACVEKLNPKMPETVEGDALKQMNQRGELTGCVVEGPISYDCAVSREIAAFKGFESPCAGDCDVLVAPNIHAGNIMGKMLTVTCKAKMAGFIVGARCPIVMTSRGSSAEEKYLSIVISAAAARNQ